MARTLIAALALLSLTAMSPALAAQGKPARSTSAKPELTGTININTASATDWNAAGSARRRPDGSSSPPKNGGFKIEDLMNAAVSVKAFLKLRPRSRRRGEVRRRRPGTGANRGAAENASAGIPAPSVWLDAWCIPPALSSRPRSWS